MEEHTGVHLMAPLTEKVCPVLREAHKDPDTMLEENTLGIGCAVDSAWSEPYVSTRLKKRL